MRKKIFGLFLCIFPLITFGQKNVLEGMQGLTLKGDMIFELEGYTMTVQREKATLDKKGISKIKKKYDLNDVVSEYSDKQIKWQNYVIENRISFKELPDIEELQFCYLLPESDNRMMVVLLQTASKRDTLIERAFMDALFSRKILDYTTDNWVAEKIDFAGREIQLGDVCRWVSPHNVHCATFGQMGWSVFKTKEEAEINSQIQMFRNNDSGKYKIEKEEEINVVFEEIPTLAKRITYKINTSKLLLGGRDQLCVYYIVQKIRGRYMSCVLSHYIEVKGDYSLPPLLKEVMSVIIVNKL